MVVSCVGYERLEKAILIGKLNENYDLGRLFLKAGEIQLNDVVVTGEREEIASGLDKKSYLMSENIAQSGGSVMDAMKTMPGVSFD